MPASRPDRPRLVIFDLDGVVYRGTEPVRGASALIADLRGRGLLIRYATNNSMASRDAYVERLAGMGIAATIDDVVTSTSATIGYLQRHLPDVKSILAAGAPSMIAELRAAGFDVTPASELARPDYQGEPLLIHIEAVVVGLDQAFDYARVAVSATAVREGAVFIATNADLRYPTPRGFLPGAGSHVAAIRAASGAVEPLVIGKPEPAIFQEILEEAKVPRQAAVVVGDNPDSDIIAAHRSGIFSVLMLTGVADAATAESLTGERRPDVIATDPPELGRLFDEWLS